MPLDRSLTVFVPALNEEWHIEATVEVVVRSAQAAGVGYQVIVVDDGSTDRTGEIVKRLAALNPAIKVIHHGNRKGLGRGYRSAIQAATTSYFVFVPGDNSWPFDSVSRFFALLGEADIITSYPTNADEQRTWLRRILSSGYTTLVNALHGFSLRYYNGLTIYPTEFLRSHPVRASGFGFAAELLLTAIYEGMSVVEVGLGIQEREGGASKAVTVRNVASVVRSLVRSYWRLRLRRTRKRITVPRRHA